jgi:hypothetical protein
MAIIYARDFARLIFQLPTGLDLPLQLFFAPGLFFLVARPLTSRAVLLLAVLCLSVVVNNLRAFEGRFYLYLLPLFGAGVGVMYERLADLANSRWTRGAVTVVLAVFYLASLPMAARESNGQVYEGQREISEAISAAKRLLEENAVIVARKRVIAHHIGADFVFLPEIDSFEGLHDFLGDQRKGQPVYLFFGLIERRLRPELASLARADESPEWLRPVAQGSERNPWVLYRYDPQ